MDLDYSKLSMTFGSKMKADEIILLLSGSKGVVRQGFYEHEYIAVTEFCQKHKIHCLTSVFKVLMTDGSSFSNRGEAVPLNDTRKGMLFVYLSFDEELALRAQYAEQVGDQKTLGLLLGYPPCCVDYFCNSFSASNSNPLQENVSGFLDLRQREKDIVLLSHFPCSLDCQESLNRAQETLTILEQFAPLRAKELRNSLGV